MFGRKKQVYCENCGEALTDITVTKTQYDPVTGERVIVGRVVRACPGVVDYFHLPTEQFYFRTRCYGWYEYSVGGGR